jgi:hypothetical protein
MVERFDASFDEFWRHVQDKYPALVIRDRAFLTWRFTPVSKRSYRILIARLQGEMLGDAVMRCAKVRGIDTRLILDLLLLDHPRGIEAGACLAAEAEIFRSKKMQLMASLLTPGSAEYQILAQSGASGHLMSRGRGPRGGRPLPEGGLLMFVILFRVFRASGALRG